MIAKSEFLMNRDQQYQRDYTQEISDNLDRLLVPLNRVRSAWDKPMVVTSGWRPPELNALIPGAATHSKHMIGLAADISDPDGSLWAWVLENLPLLQSLGLYLEDKRWTPSWVHFQLVAPQSGHRIFKPSADRAVAPGVWDGVYDPKFDEDPTRSPA